MSCNQLPMSPADTLTARRTGPARPAAHLGNSTGPAPRRGAWPRPRRAGWIAAWLLLAGSGAAIAQDAPLPAYEAQYSVQRNGKELGSSTISLSPQGEGWRYQVVVAGERGMASLVGLRIEQQMDFSWHDGGPRPTRSHYRQRATLGNREVSVDYDWAGGRYRLVDRKGEHGHALPAGTVDRYGSAVAVAAKLAAGERDFTLQVAHADGVRPWRFRVTGEEAVTTPAGPVQAVRVERIREGDSDRETISWHDPARAHVAVRMRQDEDGDSTETVLRDYTVR